MTDAMRAARDRWLANPDSAGAGAAFEAGWYARNEEVASLERFRDASVQGHSSPNCTNFDPVMSMHCSACREQARAEVAQRQAKRVIAALAGIGVAAGVAGKQAGPGFGAWCYQKVQETLIGSPTPTGEATTEERTNELPGSDRQ